MWWSYLCPVPSRSILLHSESRILRSFNSREKFLAAAAKKRKGTVIFTRSWRWGPGTTVCTISLNNVVSIKLLVSSLLPAPSFTLMLFITTYVKWLHLEFYHTALSSMKKASPWPPIAPYSNFHWWLRKWCDLWFILCCRESLFKSIERKSLA